MFWDILVGTWVSCDFVLWSFFACPLLIHLNVKILKLANFVGVLSFQYYKVSKWVSLIKIWWILGKNEQVILLWVFNMLLDLCREMHLNQISMGLHVATDCGISGNYKIFEKKIMCIISLFQYGKESDAI